MIKDKIITALILFIIICSVSNAQQNSILPVPPGLDELRIRTEKIKDVLNNQSINNSIIEEFPMQDFYHMTYLSNANLPHSLLTDVTPPSNPSNLIVHTSGIASVYVEFTPSVDPESGISYYAFGIGTAPGLANIRWWQSLGTGTTTYSLSLAQLGIAEGAVFYITIYAMNGAGLSSNLISTGPIIMNWENYGDTSNNLTIQYASQGYAADGTTVIAGWSSSQISLYNYFISKMLPIIKDIYGPPSRSNVITLVRNLYYSGSNIYFPSTNEIHKDDSFYPQLLTHELIHAFRDDVILAMDSNWNYNSKLSGFEESFAQGVSYACMNRYIQLYPNDSIANSSYLFGSSMDWDYDFRNVSNITTEDFWSDYGGMNLHWERYELGAATMRKMQLEDTNVYKKFNTAYYAYLNSHHHATPTRNLMISLFSSILPQVEGISTTDWINKQRIFDCRIQPGRKIWVRTQHYPSWSNYIIFQNAHYYETFTNGSDWAHYDNNSSSWIYYNMNGSTGIGNVKNFRDSFIWQKNLMISYHAGGFGSSVVNFSTDNDLLPWPGGDTSDFILNMNDFGLYKLHLNFDTSSTIVYRVIGQQLNNATGIFGGILNSKGGQIFIDHEGYPNEPALNIVHNAFRGSRQWASVPNVLTGGTDSKPGRLTIRYVDSLSNEYRAFRNIDWGSWAGNQVFLFDVNEMQPLPITINLKLFIQGFYSGAGLMNNHGAGGCLYVNGISTVSTDADTVYVSAMDAVTHTELDREPGILHSNGTVSIHFNDHVHAGTAYYIKVNHRNTLETWSASPVILNNNIVYDFSTAASKAFGNTQVNTVDGKFAFFSGDVNQDGTVDILDMSITDNDATAFAYGYNASDCNGDGSSDILDMVIQDNNARLFLYVGQP